MKRLSIVFAGLAVSAAAQVHGRMDEYALVLADPPAARSLESRAALRTTDGQTKVARILDAQRGVRAELTKRQFAITGAVQLLANAVFATARPERVAELKSIPGVVRVQRMPLLRRHLDRALDLQNVPAAWNSVGGSGNAGAGVKIGIIDSGIDQNHPGFQDPALAIPSGFPKGEGAYTNRKVIAARSYVSLLVDPNHDFQFATPDDTTPRDRVGHGTAIAMIAAGVRTTGPAATIQGVAPKAYLGNYKVFGSPSINDFSLYSALARAMDDAFSDGMDIVTLSLGEGDPAIDGPLDRDVSCSSDGKTVADCDVRAQLVESAVNKGMVVVTSAGNDGDLAAQYPTLNSIHTPGTAPSAITVGAVTNAHILYASVIPQGGAPINAFIGSGAKPDAAVTAPLKDVAQTGNDGQACTDLPGGSMAGAVALVQRGTCALSDKIFFAQNAGAVAVIIYDSAGNNFPFPINANDVGIPSVGIGNSAGVALKARSGSNVTLDPALHAVDAPFNSVWTSSSRGPGINTFAIKPELAAIGTDIYTATQRLDPNGDSYHPSGYTSVSGTSYAVGMVAGAAALVKQKFPAMPPAQIKSALVNTATQDVTDDNGRARVTAVGAGKLNAADAVNVAAVAEPATLSFGAVLSGSLPVNLTLRLTNVSNAGATFNLAVNQRDRDGNASVRLSRSSLTLTPGQQDTVTVALQGNRPSPGTYEGFIDITGAGPALHVPYLYVVGDGIPFNAFPVNNGGFVGAVNQTDWIIGLRAIDRYGVPVVNAPVQWRVTAGAGKVVQADVATVNYGYAAANVTLGPKQGDQIFTGTVGGLTVEFDGFAGPVPNPSPNGIVNAASNDAGNGLAPGSYISIYGDSIAPTTAVERTASLPLSLATTSVSFESGGVMAPGRIHFVSPGQINVQIPWEMQGKSSARLKVTIAPYVFSPIVGVPLATYSPAIFVRNGVAAALDTNFKIIGSDNPARRGQAVQLYCNGLGPVDSTPPTGEPTPAEQLVRTRVSATVTVGGRPAQVIFSGLAPNNVGLYQVNAIVPADAPTGTQPVVVSIGGVDSKPANMPVQ